MLIFLIIVQLGAKDLQKRVGQRHKSRPEDSTTTRTATETTSEAKPGAEDCKDRQQGLHRRQRKQSQARDEEHKQDGQRA